MDWDRLAFLQTLKDEFADENHRTGKSSPAVYLSPSPAGRCRYIAADHWRLGWLKAYQQKTALPGASCNDSQLNTPKAILIDLDPRLPVPDYSRCRPDSLTQPNIAIVVVQQNYDFLLVFGPC